MTEEVARSALARVTYPGLNSDIVALGLVRSVTVRNERVHVSLTVSTERPDVPDLLRADIKTALHGVGGVRSEVQILAPERWARKSDPWAGRGRMAGVKRVIAVGAGKGGAGKSTVAVNLALALRGAGLMSGVMDADIYGSSVPVLVGLEDGATRIQMTAEKHILPLDALGLSVVSFGFFLGPESPGSGGGPWSERP